MLLDGARLAASAVRRPGTATAVRLRDGVGRRLLIAHLLQPHHGAAQKLPHRARADSQRRRRFPDTAGLPSAETGSASAARSTLPPRGEIAACVRDPAVRSPACPDDWCSGMPDLGVERLFRLLPRADLQTQIVRHPENPGARILNLLALAHGGVQAQEDFLHRFLRPGRVQPQRQQVPVDVVARFLEQPGTPGLAAECPCVPDGACSRIVRRTRMTTFPLHPKTPETCFQLHLKRKIIQCSWFVNARGLRYRTPLIDHHAGADVCVSIVTFNSSRYIGRCLEAVLNQRDVPARCGRGGQRLHGWYP